MHTEAETHGARVPASHRDEEALVVEVDVRAALYSIDGGQDRVHAALLRISQAMTPARAAGQAYLCQREGLDADLDAARGVRGAAQRLSQELERSQSWQTFRRLPDLRSEADSQDRRSLRRCTLEVVHDD